MQQTFICFYYIISFILGLIIGSFINCLVYRLHVGKSVLSGRSFCPHCKHQITWYDNIPLLSFILLKGKCRYCAKKISNQYPLVELATGILFVVISLANSQSLFNASIISWLILFRNLIFTAILIIIFVYDYKYYLILDKVSIPAIVIALILNIGIKIIEIQIFNLQASIFNIFGQYILSALALAGFFLIQFLVSNGKWIGGGDIRLGVLIGFMLGWPMSLLALFLAYIFGSVIGILLIIFKKKNIKSQIAFGTFLTSTSFIVLVWGDIILDWYLGFLYL